MSEQENTDENCREAETFGPDRPDVPEGENFSKLPNGEVVETLPYTPNRVGRPSFFNPDYHPAKALEWASNGYTIGMIAARFGVSRTCFEKWLDRDDRMGGMRRELYNQRRAHLEAHAMRADQGLNKSRSVETRLARLRYGGPEGHEYMDPSKTQIDLGDKTGDRLSNAMGKMAQEISIKKVKKK